VVLVVWVTLLHHGIPVEKDDAHEGEDLGPHVVPAQRIVQREGRKRGENERVNHEIDTFKNMYSARGNQEEMYQTAISKKKKKNRGEKAGDRRKKRRKARFWDSRR